MCWGTVTPLLLLVFPAFHSKGPQNGSVQPHSTQRHSHRCRSDAQGEGGTHGRREWEPQAPGTPSWIQTIPFVAGTQGRSQHGHAGKCQAAMPSQSCAWEGDPGAVGARTGSRHDRCPWSGSFLQRWKCPAWCGQGEGLGDKELWHCGHAQSHTVTHSHTQPGSASPMIFHITCLPSVLTSVLLWLPRA